MPERQRYAHLFGRNPFEGKNPRDAYEDLHWGNPWDSEWEIDAPEPLSGLGMVAQLVSTDNVAFTFRKTEAFLALGTRSNELYIIPRIRGGAPIPVVPRFSRTTAEYVGDIKQTDYWSMKGGSKEHYYYHQHERPYPGLWLNHAAGVGYLRAAMYNGKPSYAVGKEGIVG